MSNLNQLVSDIVELYNVEVDKSIEALLCFGGCTERDDIHNMQIQLANNGYDIVMCKFKNNVAKTFVYLTDIKNKFIKGYLVEIDFNNGKINRELVKSKIKFESIIKDTY